MSETYKTFSIDDIELYTNDDDLDFATVKIWALAEFNNSHGNPIDFSVLEKYAPTILGKFIIAKFDKFKGDVETHVPDQSIMGYVLPTQDISFEEKDGKRFITVLGVLSKLYAVDVVQMFKKHNHREVSCEFTCIEAEEDENGNRAILSFDIHGITILGLEYRASCAGAEIEVIKFAETHNANTFNKLKDFSERRKELMAGKTYKVNKSKDAMSNTPWGNVDKTALRNKILEASNKASLVKSVYMQVESGWEDAPSEKLKYPVMEFKGDELVYNRGGLSLALGYAKAGNESAVVSKVESIYKKLGLDEGEEKKMAEKFSEIESRVVKTFGELEGRQLYGEVIRRVESKLGKDMFVEDIQDKKVVVKNAKTGELWDIPANIKVGKDDESMSIDIDYDGMKKSVDQKAFAKADEKEVDKADKDTEPNDAKDAKDGKGDDEDAEEFAKDDTETCCDSECAKECADTKECADKECECDSDKKEFSYNADIDMAAFNAMLENETDQYKEMVNEMFDSKDMNIIMSKYLEMAKEKDNLQAYKDAKMAEEVKCAVDACLADAKDDLTPEQFSDLQEKGKELSMEEFAEFSNNVKAFAYENTKGRKSKKATNHIEMKGFAEFLDNKSNDINNTFSKYCK